MIHSKPRIYRIARARIFHPYIRNTMEVTIFWWILTIRTIECLRYTRYTMYPFPSYPVDDEDGLTESVRVTMAASATVRMAVWAAVAVTVRIVATVWMTVRGGGSTTAMGMTVIWNKWHSQFVLIGQMCVNDRTRFHPAQSIRNSIYESSNETHRVVIYIFCSF